MKMRCSPGDGHIKRVLEDGGRPVARYWGEEEQQGRQGGLHHLSLFSSPLLTTTEWGCSEMYSLCLELGYASTNVDQLKNRRSVFTWRTKADINKLAHILNGNRDGRGKMLIASNCCLLAVSFPALLQHHLPQQGPGWDLQKHGCYTLHTA